MTADTTPTLAGSKITISPDLLDALASAVFSCPNARARSSVICDLILEMCSTVESLALRESGQRCAIEEEIASVRQLAGAAYDHRVHMTFLARAAGSGAR